MRLSVGGRFGVHPRHGGLDHVTFHQGTEIPNLGGLVGRDSGDDGALVAHRGPRLVAIKECSVDIH